MPILPEFFEPLGDAIGDAFALDELDKIMRKTTGCGLFKEYVPEGHTHRDTAYKLLVRVDELGIESIVLGEVLAWKPNDAKLRVLIGKACPAALATPPSTEEKAWRVVSGLAAIGPGLDLDDVKQALAASLPQLRAVADSMDILRIYKDVHDCLHQLQFKQFQDLRLAAKKLPGDPSQAAALIEYQSQLETACFQARQSVESLPDGPALRQMELSWIEGMEASILRFQSAIEDKAAPAAQVALNEIRRVLRVVPSRLNEQIFLTANNLPLAGLADVLQQVSTAMGDRAGAVSAAHRAMQLIIPTLRARVVEHKSWQDIDNKIADLDELFEHGGADLGEEFALYWPDLKGRVLALVSLDPGANWATSVALYSGQIDDFLAGETVDGAFKNAFLAYRLKARFRFRAVDLILKSDCAALEQISAPLHAILAEFDDG